MPSQYLEAFDARVRLTDIERGVLAAVDVRSDEDVDSLMRSVPSLANIGVRVQTLVAAVEPNLSPGYRDVVGMLPNLVPSFGLGANIPPDSPFPVGSPAPIPSPARTVPPVPSVFPAGSATASIDLRLNPWPVRHQGNRGTCVAFGATACVEHYSASGGIPDFSEQFLYWAIKTHSGDPDKTEDGTFLRYARQMLGQFGICTEAIWKYVKTEVIPVSGATATDPTAIAKTDASTRRREPPIYVRFPSNAAAKVLQLLKNGRPVAVCLHVFGKYRDDPDHNWNEAAAFAHGHIKGPAATTMVIGGHCVCISGFKPDPDGNSGGGFFIFRNSWGTSFASRAPSPPVHHSPQQGYGYLSATYVDKYCDEILQC